MPGFEHMGKMLIFMGIFIVVMGLLVMLWGKVPGLGKLPGDIYIERENFRFFFPVVSCLLISVCLTIIINLVMWFLGK